MRLSKKRKEQLGAYGQTFVPDNGLIAINELVEIFNEKEDEQVIFEEMLHALRRFVATTPKKEVKFAIYNDEYLFSSELNNKQVKDLIINNEISCCGGECEQHNYEKATTKELESITTQFQTEYSNQQAELIGLTAEISAPLYGVLNFQELAEILNHYHQELKIVKDDILPALTEHIKLSGEEVDYTIFEGFIVSPMILPDATQITDVDIELIDYIRNEQKKHKRYLPDYEEFVLYATPIHEMMTDEFEKFLGFLMKNRKRLGISERKIGETATIFLQLSKASMNPKYFIEFFQEEGCRFSSTQFINEFMGYAVEVYNHTRKYDCNGHTLSELNLVNSTKTPTNVLNTPKANVEGAEVEVQTSKQRMIAKVGRNDSCPCNSGKKYKKCCLS